MHMGTKKIFYWKNITTCKPCLRTIKVWAKNIQIFIIIYYMIIYLQFCLVGKFLLTMRPQKYVFHHFNYPWDQDQTGNKPYWQTFCSKKISMLTVLKVSSLARKYASYRTELTRRWGPHGTEIKFFKFKTEMYQGIELKEYTCKMGSFV